MTSKNWSRRFALVCGISLLAPLGAAGQTPAAAKSPAVALIDSNDASQWQTWTKAIGWQVVTAPAAPDADIDARTRALAAAVTEAVTSGSVDPARVYVAGRNEAAAAVFYAISRIPDRWAAGVALGGSPKAALETNRIFAANFTDAPVLWASAGTDDEATAEKLKTAGVNLEWRSAAGLTNEAILEWLSRHRRDEFPMNVDCETNSPAFASCYWIQMTKFDAAERNDVLPASLVAGELSASLDLGGFGFHAADPGPGVPVVFLPQKYSGPLRMGDRIVELDGKPIANPKQFLDMLARVSESQPAAVMVERGKERVRIETRILVPRRDPVVTGRVQAHYLPDFHQLEIVSRAVTEMRVTLPPEWVPFDLFWNGLSLEDVKTAGCYLLKLDKELLHASPCQ